MTSQVGIAVAGRREIAATILALAGNAAAAAAVPSTGSGAQQTGSSAAPVQTPITGTEELGDLSRPEQALAQFYKAFMSRDIAMMQDNWENSGEAVLDNPLGGIRRGWPEIRQVYERIFNSKAQVVVEFYDYTLVREGGVFWAAGRERGTFTTGPTSLQLAIRTSRIFRRRESRWHQVHHHGSIDDPKLLAAYQEAVR